MGPRVTGGDTSELSPPRWQPREEPDSLSLPCAGRHSLSFGFCHFGGVWSTLKWRFCCLFPSRGAVKYRVSQIASARAWLQCLGDLGRGCCPGA